MKLFHKPHPHRFNGMTPSPPFIPVNRRKPPQDICFLSNQRVSLLKHVQDNDPNHISPGDIQLMPLHDLSKESELLSFYE